jgi:Protein of unknown function (DUF2510)
MTTLSEQPPPRRGAKAGYYPDPLQSGRARYWDGSSWTLTIGPQIAADAPKSRTVPPPTKVCRHCGAQAETFEGNCPHCGRGYGQSSGPAIAAIVAACVLLILFLGGCAVFIGAVVEEADFDDEAISQREFDSLQIGTTIGAVRARFGRPLETAEIETGRRRATCLYYEDADQPFEEDDYFELCFAGGKLYAKRAFSS